MIVFKQSIENIATDLENQYPDYDETATYNSTDKVSHNGFYWQMIPDNIVGKEPSESSLYWTKIGVSNKDAVIDLRSLTKSTSEDSFYVQFDIDYTYSHLAIGYYSTENIKIEALDNDGNIVKEYLNETQSINEDVYDYYDYIYGAYSLAKNRTRFIPLTNAGQKIKITLTGGTSITNPSCGFIQAGNGIYMGEALQNINFKLNSYSVKETDDFGTISIDKRAVQNLIDFETAIDKGQFMNVRREIKELYDEFCCFILDENDTSSELVGIGTIQDISQLYDEYDKSIIGCSIMEAI